MPKQQQTTEAKNRDPEISLAIAYEAFNNLGWDVLFAGEDRIVGHTQKSWSKKGQQILAEMQSGLLIVQSEMVSGDSFDITGINKKNVAAFISAFKNAENTISTETVAQNKNELNALKEKTKLAAEQETKDAEEINNAMHLKGSNLYATYGLIAANLLIFILMVFDGAGIMEPNSLVHIKWGSNYSVLTLSGDWWRLITNIFIHFGIIHVAFNMYALYMVGVYLEPMLGKTKYLVAYFCTGVLASLTSLWWHKEGINSAGASGAIFGMFGLFLALLTTDLIPKKLRESLLKTFGIFIVYNLVYGMKSGVDNAAHVGGLVSGFIIGYGYVLMIKQEKNEKKMTWVMPAVVIATIAITFGFLEQNKIDPSKRSEAVSSLKETGYKDNDKFIDKYNEFVVLQKQALEPMKDSTLTNVEMKQKLTEISMPLWIKAEGVVDEMKGLDVSKLQHKKAETVGRYIALRIQEINAANKVLDSEPNAVDSLNTVRTQIDEILNELK